MDLTKAKRKRLAKEMRKLAMEVLSGTAPRMIPYSYCGCAIGQVIERVEGRLPSDENGDDPLFNLANELDLLLPDRCNAFEGVVSQALRAQMDEYVPIEGAVVFPLLALADAVEDAAPASLKEGE